MDPTSPLPIQYTIDAEDRIVDVADGWVKFAEENDGQSVMPDLVVGRSLWAFIAGTTLRELYRKLLKTARGGVPVIYEYRCDAPCWRRFFEMQIRTTGDGLLRFTSTLKSEERRDAVPLLDCHASHGQDFVTMCSWCQRISAGGQWLPVEQSIDKLGLMLSPFCRGSPMGSARTARTRCAA